MPVMYKPEIIDHTLPTPIIYPFKSPPFLLEQLRAVTKYTPRRTRNLVPVRVKHKTEVPAGGDGIFHRFSKGPQYK